MQQFANLAKHLEVLVDYISEKFQPLYILHSTLDVQSSIDTPIQSGQTQSLH